MSHQNSGRLARRNFLRHSLFGAAGLSALYVGGGVFGCGTPRGAAALFPAPGEGEPERLSPRAVLTNEGEPGEPLLVTGRILAADGRTPVEGITLYVYHTDARGLYSEQDGRGGEPRPRLKGWMRTGRDGSYEFRTIKPAAYPGRRNPAHVHAKVYGAGRAESWIDEYWFDDDPLVTAEMRARFKGLDDFSPILKLTRTPDGLLKGVRHVRLASA